jgi:hypothetical protein
MIARWDQVIGNAGRAAEEARTTALAEIDADSL